MNDLLLVFLLAEVSLFLALTFAGRREDYNLRKRKNTNHLHATRSINIRSNSIDTKKLSEKGSDSSRLAKKVVKSHSNKKTQSEEELLNQILKDVLNIRK